MILLQIFVILNNKLPEKNKPYKCVSLISLDSITKFNKKILSTNTFTRMCIKIYK